MDKGPWSVALDRDGRAFAVQSEDFEHDVLLRVSGDFADDAQRLAYCEWLAATLNAGEKHAEIAPLTPVEEVAPNDSVCGCFGDNGHNWGPVCKNFQDDDQGYCDNCGHREDCHDQQ